MVLLEIAAQGVRGFAPERGRIAFRPGYNVVAGDGATLRRLIAALLQPDQAPDPVLRPDGPGSARAGITLSGDDGVTWRVVRDLGGPCQLQRYDPEKRTFQSVLQDPVRIAEVLRAAGAPSTERLEVVLSVAAADFPSRQPVAVGPATPAPSTPSRRIAATPVEARRKLEAARAELANAHQTEKLQQRMDELQSRLFRLEELLKSGEQVKERLRAGQAGVEGFVALEAALGALGDPAARLAAAARATARRDEALAKVAAERAALEEEGGATKPRPLSRTVGFLAGAAAGGIALLGGLVSGTRIIALAAIPATGWAAFEGLRWVGRAEAAEQAGRRARVLAERERKANEFWERDTADVRAVMKRVGVPNLAALDDVAGRAREARAALGRAEAEMQAWKEKADTQDAEAERAAVQQEIGSLETEITSGTGGFVRDVHSLEQEIGRLEREVETGPFQPLADAVLEPPVEAPRPRGEPLRMLVERASAELGITPGAALRASQAKVQQLLPALSGQRFTSFLVDERGNVQVQAAGKLVPLASLGAPERDVCFAVLKIAFLELGLAAGKSVGVVDDAFATLPEGSRRVLSRVLKQLARGRQIVHGTTDVLFREAADHAA